MSTNYSDEDGDEARGCFGCALILLVGVPLAITLSLVFCKLAVMAFKWVFA